MDRDRDDTEQQPDDRAAAAAEIDDTVEAYEAGEPGPLQLSVMEWLLGVGHVVVRRLRGVPPSPMISLYPKD